MRHLVAEINQFQESRTRDTATVVEALIAASTRSGSPGAVDNGVGRTTDPAVRKLQGKDPEFTKYNGNPEHFMPWFVAVEERKELRQLSDQAAIIFAPRLWNGMRGEQRSTVRNLWICESLRRS